MNADINVIKNMGLIAEDVYENPFGFKSKGYSVEKTSPISENGFQAVLLKKNADSNTPGSQYVLAFRGTEFEFSVEGWRDLVETDIFQMGTKSIAAQFIEAIMFVHDMIATYGLTYGNTTLTGHSLGGAIGTAISYAFGMQSFGFNPFGIEGNTLFQADTLGEIFQQFSEIGLYQMPWDDPINPPQISDLAAYYGTDPVKFATFYNSTEPLSKHVEDNVNFVTVDKSVQEFVSGVVTDIAGGLIGDVQPIMNHAGDALWAHSIADLNKSIAVYNNLIDVFPGEDYSSLTAKICFVVCPVAAHENQVEEFLLSLGKLFSIGTFSSSGNEDRSIELKNAVAGLPTLTLQSLGEESHAQVMALSNGNQAHLYALLNLNSFVVTGFEGFYSHLDDQTLGNYSDQYWEDRAQFLYHAMHPEIQSTTDFSTLFKDEAIGKQAFVEKPDSMDIAYMAFGTEAGDEINGAGQDDHLYGMGGDDTLNGDAGNDYIEGGKGNDTIIGGEGNNTLVGGIGDDTFVVEGPGTEDSHDVFLGGDGTDTILGDGSWNDVIRVHELTPGNSIETIDGGVGNRNILSGTSGNDIIDVSATTLVNIAEIRGEGGNDYLKGNEGQNVLTGGEGDDYLAGGGENDRLEGGELDDYLDGGAGNDLLIGGPGDNKLMGGSGDDSLAAQNPHQLGEGENTLWGESGDDTLGGGGGSDTLYGGSGDDETIGHGGNDTMFDESGFDYYFAMPGDVILDADGKGSVQIDVITTEDFDDIFTIDSYLVWRDDDGDLEPDIYWQGWPTSRRHIERPGASADYWESDPPDYVSPNPDYNRFIYRMEGTDLIITGGTGEITIRNFNNGDLGITLREADGTESNIESCKRQYGTSAGETLNGDQHAAGTIDVIYGDGGNDTLIGGGGDDILVGDEGDDILIGGTGDDTLSGGNGIDTAQFSGQMADYDLHYNGRDLHISSITDGSDRLVNVEKLQFSDQTIDLTVPLTVGSTWAETQEDSPLTLSAADLLANCTAYAWDELRVLEVGDAQGGVVHQDGEGNYIFTPEANFNGTAGFSFWVMDVRGRSVKTFAEIEVQPVADPASLAVSDASGDEDSRIALDIRASITNLSATENLEVSISGVPDGANLSAGVYNGNGTWTLTSAQLSELTLTPPQNSDDDFTLTVTARTREDNGSATEVSQILNVTVTGVADRPVLVVADADGGPIAPIALIIQGSLMDTDGSESLMVEISNIPDGASLSSGTDNGNGSWTLTPDQLAGLTFIPGLGSAGEFDLMVTARSTESNGLYATDVQIIHVTVDPDIKGTSRDDLLVGGPGDDILLGFAGNDTLMGGDGNDFLAAGPGRDIAIGGAGLDTYLFQAGDGSLTIDDQGSNTLTFGEGISAASVSLGLGSLLIRTGVEGDEIHIENFNPDDVHEQVAIDRFEFADGTILTYEELIAGGFDLNGTDGDDEINGTNVDDRIQGHAGCDLLNGGSGADIISGGEGNDFLSGADGNDTLDGGAGDDRLWGGGGNDVYHFGRGSGQDRIYDLSGEHDALRILAGVTPEQIKVSRAASDLYIEILESEDRLRIQNWFEGNNHKIETIEFSDGTVWNAAQLERQLITMSTTGSEEDDTLTGLDGENNEIIGLGGNDVLCGGNGDDIIYGGNGDDTLTGNFGDDTLIGGSGNDVLAAHQYYYFYSATGDSVTFNGGPGNDDIFGGSGSRTQYIFASGDGQDSILDFGGADDTISFTEGIRPDDVQVTRQENHLVLRIPSSGDQLTIKSWFGGLYYLPQTEEDKANNITYYIDGQDQFKIEKVEFADGTTWDVDTLYEKAFQNNNAPELTTPLPNQSVQQGQPFHFRIPLGTFNDPDIGDDLTFTATLEDGSPLPEWLTYHNEFFSGTSPNEQSDILAIKVVAEDRFGLVVSDSFRLSFFASANLGGMLEDGTILITTFQLLANASLPNEEGYYVRDLSSVAGSLVDNANGTWSFTPETDWNGSAGFSYVITNGPDVLNASADLSVAAVNDAPAVAGTVDLGMINDGTQVVFSDQQLLAKATDVDGDILTVENLTASHGSFVNNGNGTWTYITESGYAGAVEIGYSVVDGQGCSTPGYAAMEVYPPHINLIPGTENDEILYGTPGVDALAGKGGNDTLDAGDGDDTLLGGMGNDYLLGGAGDDLLVAGQGDDLADGGEGHDVYVYQRGDGILYIRDEGINTLRFGSGISSADISLGLGSLLIRTGVEGDEVHIENFNPNDVYGQTAIDRFEFADGTVLSYEELLARGFDLEGTNYANILDGTSVDDRIRSLAGDDTIAAKAGNDTLDGGSGNDTLLGGEGDDYLYGGDDGEVVGYDYGGYDYGGVDSNDDYLDGGAGNDTLDGGSGNDTLLGGEGSDTLHGGSGNDLLDGGAGIDAMAGGAGNDVYYVDGYAEVTVIPGDEDDGTNPGHDCGEHRRNHHRSGRKSHENHHHHGDRSNRNDSHDQGSCHHRNTSNHPDISCRSRDNHHDRNGYDDHDSCHTHDNRYSHNGYSGHFNNRFNLANLFRRNDGRHHGACHDHDGRHGHYGFHNCHGHDEVPGWGPGCGDNGQGSTPGSDDQIITTCITDTVMEEAGNGYDAVYSSITYSLTDHVEELHLTGTEDYDATGNDLDNVIVGNSGANTLDGGLGNDLLTGGSGDDTYLFKSGDGRDTIDNDDSTGFDRVLFGDGVDTAQVALFRSGNHLQIGYENDDRVTVHDFFSGPGYQINEILLADGSYLTDADINQIIQQMSVYAVDQGIALNDISDVYNNQDMMTLVANAWQGS